MVKICRGLKTFQIEEDINNLTLEKYLDQNNEYKQKIIDKKEEL